jgi:hypothetical protein
MLFLIHKVENGRGKNGGSNGLKKKMVSLMKEKKNLTQIERMNFTFF